MVYGVDFHSASAQTQCALCSHLACHPTSKEAVSNEGLSISGKVPVYSTVLWRWVICQERTENQDETHKNQRRESFGLRPYSAATLETPCRCVTFYVHACTTVHFSPDHLLKPARHTGLLRESSCFSDTLLSGQVLPEVAAEKNINCDKQHDATDEKREGTWCA